MIENVKYSSGNRSEIIEYIKTRRQNGRFTVIDVGGSVSGWSHEVVDAVVDIQSVDNANIRVFKANINLPCEWTDVDEYVRQHGKFDFSICSHTLEDISNPKYVCMKLSEISKEGFIAFPSEFQELSRFECDQYRFRGCIHHRWIFTIENNKLVGYPKMPYLEYIKKFDDIASRDKRISDLSFTWKDEIQLHIINNDYIGDPQYEQLALFDGLLNYPLSHDLVQYDPAYISKPHWVG